MTWGWPLPAPLHLTPGAGTGEGLLFVVRDGGRQALGNKIVTEPVGAERFVCPAHRSTFILRVINVHYPNPSLFRRKPLHAAAGRAQGPSRGVSPAARRGQGTAGPCGRVPRAGGSLQRALGTPSSHRRPSGGRGAQTCARRSAAISPLCQAKGSEMASNPPRCRGSWAEWC